MILYHREVGSLLIHDTIFKQTLSHRFYVRIVVSRAINTLAWHDLHEPQQIQTQICRGPEPTKKDTTAWAGLKAVKSDSQERLSQYPQQ